ADVPDQLRNEIMHFFAVYKDLDPNRHSSVKGWQDRDEALAEIERSRERFRAESGAAVS
ncbi:MAG: inorganic diphosphatase, partial [Solirubrobacterales bacterium]|nr:inorganic diphosphatase [Solirubrobacterales bacterium]